MARHTMKITVTALVPVPKHRDVALELGIAVADAIQTCGSILRKVGNSRGLDLPEGTASTHIAYLDDAEPAPAPKRRGRRPRAALGSSPLNPVTGAPHPNSSAGDPRAGQPQTISTTGPDGEDLLEIPPSLDRRAATHRGG